MPWQRVIAAGASAGIILYQTQHRAGACRRAARLKALETDQPELKSGQFWPAAAKLIQSS